MIKLNQHKEPRGTYHFLESYLNREQIERVLNHYRDYISAALYILHDKDVHHVEKDGGVRRTELQTEYNKIQREINLIEIAINNALDILATRSFSTEEEKALFRKMEVTEKKRKRTLLQKKSLRIHDDIRKIDDELKDEGTFKKPHYHILLKCYGAHTENAVRKWFYRFYVTEEVVDNDSGEKVSMRINTLNKLCDSVCACRDYLTHKNEPEELGKFVYDVKDVIEFGAGWQAFNKVGRSSDDCLEILDRMNEGATRRELARDYGRDMLINYDKYMRYAMAMEYEEQRAKEVVDSESDIIRRAEKDKDTNWYAVLDHLNVAHLVENITKSILEELGGKH